MNATLNRLVEINLDPLEGPYIDARPGYESRAMRDALDALRLEHELEIPDDEDLEEHIFEDGTVRIYLQEIAH